MTMSTALNTHTVCLFLLVLPGCDAFLGHLDKEQMHSVVPGQLWVESRSQEMSLTDGDNSTLGGHAVIPLQLRNDLNLLSVQDLIDDRGTNEDTGEPSLGLLQALDVQTGFETLLLSAKGVALDADAEALKQLLITLEGASGGDLFREQDQASAGAPGRVGLDKLLESRPESGAFGDQGHGGGLPSGNDEGIDLGNLLCVTDGDGLRDLGEGVEEDDVLCKGALESCLCRQGGRKEGMESRFNNGGRLVSSDQVHG